MCLLEVNDLTVLSNKVLLPILNKLNVVIKPYRITALIGESGSGKTVFSRTISGLLPDLLRLVSGDFFFKKNRIEYRWLQKNRGKTIFYTPQNAAASLNPVRKIKSQINEIENPKEYKIKSIFANLPFHDSDRILNSYPYELSDGECQRCVLAMAIALSPYLLVLDEPVASLDIPAQKDFMNLLKNIQNNLEMTILILSHNLELVCNISDYLYVIWKGSIVDEGCLEKLISYPGHEYTRQITRYL